MQARLYPVLAFAVVLMYAAIGCDSNGCRSGIYNGVNILQTHCRWYVTHWFF